MKKLILTTLITVLAALLVLGGCGKKTKTDPKTKGSEKDNTSAVLEAESQTESLSGGWSVTEKFGTPTLQAEPKAAFDRAIQDGCYTAVAYLGSQVVAGTNYAYLCTDTNGALNTVVIYNDLQNNSLILNAKAVNIADYNKDGKLEKTPEAGGFSYADAVGAPLEKDLQTVFDKATAELTGVTYEPLVCLGSQVVAGTNYSFLCKVTAEPTVALAVVTVYCDLEQSATVTSVCGFTV